MKYGLIIGLLIIILVSGCIPNYLRTTPYIKEISYFNTTNQISFNITISNPTKNDYSPVKLDIDFDKNIFRTPQDWNSEDKKELEKIKAEGEKTYNINLPIMYNNKINQTLISFRIYNYQNYLFDKKDILIS